MRKFLKYSCWAIAGILAIGALCYNTFHLATASLIFIIGTFQDDKEE
jgi:hypothetical protein